jgi:hypothetical protein
MLLRLVLEVQALQMPVLLGQTEIHHQSLADLAHLLLYHPE